MPSSWPYQVQKEMKSQQNELKRFNLREFFWQTDHQQNIPQINKLHQCSAVLLDRILITGLISSILLVHSLGPCKELETPASTL